MVIKLIQNNHVSVVYYFTPYDRERVRDRIETITIIDWLTMIVQSFFTVWVRLLNFSEYSYHTNVFNNLLKYEYIAFHWF